MNRMYEHIDPQGFFRATHICKTRSGIILPLREVVDNPKIKDIERWNLVVNSGRQVVARCLAGHYQTASPAASAPYINRLILGEGEKQSNLPNLTDTGLVQEIAKITGTPSGTFLLDGPHEASPDITLPASARRWPLSGDFTANNAAITINASEETILTDATVDFTSIGVELTDQVTIDNSSTNPLVFGIREVRSATELVLHNPNGYTGTSRAWRIETPGTQMLVSRLIEGNTFTQADYGGAVVCHEAGLLFNNSTLFNRVVFNPTDEEVGILLQSDELTGVEISVRFEWLVTV